MVTGSAVPAAQYLRMSTEHQRYSLENQITAIRAYAEKTGFAVVHTYVDEGKSGLLLKRRNALQQLLSDVVSGAADYKAILVYDISRWGRFQDVDEAAHYEFLCRETGTQIHYCAEPFGSDSSLPSSLMKALKRVMAAEYSRELSTKVHEGSKRIAESGFRTGGEPGYGLRRMLVSYNREPKYLLAKGERKSLQSDHVILVPGPDKEVDCIRDIFRMFIQEHKWPAAIAAELQRREAGYTGAKRTGWYTEAVSRVLKNPKYCGCSVFGQSMFRLHTRRTLNPRGLWTVTKGAWEGIVDQETFDQAQNLFRSQTFHKTDADLLSGLQRLFHERGSLSEKLINESRDLPSVKPYVRRFGSLSEAFEKIGYIGSRLAPTRAKRETRAIRTQFVQQVIATDPTRISLVQPDGHFRPRFRVLGLLVSLYVCRCSPRRDGQLRWLLSPVRRERNCIALIVRLNQGNESIMDMYIVSDTRSQQRYQFTPDDPWLRRGMQLRSLGDFLEGVQSINGVRKLRVTA
jgi:DNA invertase Pin-like site-specific DNA recombinase